ncbi:MAG: formylglycine-generating enzyme family protein, partial [Victivallales bacterium]|nr:formylglycine-generating enzyme family protein [Victivallales bacterium]
GTSAVNVVTLPPIEGSMEIPTLTRGDGYPMFNITYEEAMEFCKRLTEQYRLAAQKLDKKTYYKLPEDLEFSLPTEAQWEYACRAGTQTPYSTGEVLLAREANYNVVKIKEQVVVTTNDNNNNNWGEPGENNNNQKKEKKVRFHEKNYIPRLHVVGVGNPNAFGLFDMHGNVWEWCKGCYYPYSQQKAVDPKGLRSGALNVVRGGSWYSIERDCRSARRWDIDGKTRQNNIGFRVVIIKK